MKVREIMTRDPICCVPSDTAQSVARIMRERNIGSVPVVLDKETRHLFGMITDRDLCLAVVAEGLDPKTTKIEKYITLQPVACRDGENMESCERLMQEHQVRRIPVVDGDYRAVGIVAQADVALADRPEKVSRTIKEVSKPGPKRNAA